MTNPKHTPGPWVIDDTGMYLQVRGNLSDRKHLAHEEVIARVSHWDDARIITAAPELFEYVKAIEARVAHIRRALLDRRDASYAGILLSELDAQAHDLILKVNGVPND